MRLDRLISQHTGIARAKVGTLFRRGKVVVNGVVQRDGSVHVSTSTDAIQCEGVPVRLREELTLMMNKPAGVITATESDEHATVMDSIPPELRRRGLSPAGRLDKDTTGLLILTTDGGLSHMITHPRRKLSKTYIATLLDGALDDDAEARFSAGMTLADGTQCRAAGLLRLDGDRVRVELREGQFHQVKRMLGHCGGHVIALHRDAIGPLQLDAALAQGQVRALRPAELSALRGAVDGGESEENNQHRDEKNPSAR